MRTCKRRNYQTCSVGGSVTRDRICCLAFCLLLNFLRLLSRPPSSSSASGFIFSMRELSFSIRSLRVPKRLPRSEASVKSSPNRFSACLLRELSCKITPASVSVEVHSSSSFVSLGSLFLLTKIGSIALFTIGILTVSNTHKLYYMELVGREQ